MQENTFNKFARKYFFLQFLKKFYLAGNFFVGNHFLQSY